MVSNTSRNGGAVMIALNRRRTMGKTLPYDAEIEYLQGDGAAYIDTGVKVTSNIRYECSFAISEVPATNHAIFGGREGLNDKSSVLFYLYNDTDRFSWRYGNTTPNGYTTNKKTGDFFATNLNTARIMVVDGANITGNASTFTTNYSVYIFAMNNGGAVTMNNSSSVIRIKWMKIYDGTTLVRDFIPVKKNSIGYLYDKVSGQLFGNSGSGSFILGNDK